MKHYIILLSTLLVVNQSCKNNEQVDKSYGKLTHEDVVSMEESAEFSYANIIYEGKFKGEYDGETMELELDEDGDFTVKYKTKTIEGEWFKKDDGSLFEFDSNKKLPFQFLKWSDKNTIMILNADGTADENGENYLTRIEN